MSTNQSTTNIQSYNEYLVTNKIQIHIIDYVKQINNKCFNIDISFIDEFIELVSKDECCIHHSLLKKYEISSLTGGSKDINRLLKQYDFIKDEDFRLSIVAESKSGGCTHKNEYYLHPRAFKLCLMRSLNTKTYAKYYILLEECIKHYNDYQLLLQHNYVIKLKDKIKENKVIIQEKDNKIDELNTKIDLLLKNNEKSLEDNKKLFNELTKTNQKLDQANEHLENIQDELSDVQSELHDTNAKLEIAYQDRVPKSNSIQYREYFILLKSIKQSSYQYYALRGQKRYTDKKLIDFANKYEIVKSYEYIPNAINLLVRIKEQLKSHIDFCGNKLNILNISHSNFVNKIDEIYKEKNIILIH